mgnify:CR=1 FL=1
MGHDARPRTGGTHLPKGAGEKELMRWRADTKATGRKPLL